MPDKIANPDNLSFSPAMHTLFIGEDSGMHANNFVWAFNVETRKLARILSVPMGAEATGLQVVDNINGHGYVMSNYQHAGERIDIKDEALKAEVENLTDRFTTAIGYIGGLPGVGAGPQELCVTVNRGVSIVTPDGSGTIAAAVLDSQAPRPAAVVKGQGPRALDQIAGLELGETEAGAPRSAGRSAG